MQILVSSNWRCVWSCCIPPCYPWWRYWRAVFVKLLDEDKCCRTGWWPARLAFTWSATFGFVDRKVYVDMDERWLSRQFGPLLGGLYWIPALAVSLSLSPCLTVNHFFYLFAFLAHAQTCFFVLFCFFSLCSVTALCKGVKLCFAS